MDKVLQTIKFFTKQCRQALTETSVLDFSSYQGVKNICICSMGASSFGYYAVRALFQDELRIPIMLNSDYSLPGFINKDSLVFLSSYSGETEEPIASLKAALLTEAKITGITKETSEPGRLLTQSGWPFYKLIPTYNPSGQPRMASGYMIVGLIGMLQKLKFLGDKSSEIMAALDFVDQKQEEIEKMAKEAAGKLSNRQIIITAAGHLAGNAHILRNQFNESAKNFSDYFILPELNHHLLESLAHPNSLGNTALFLAFNSYLYDAKIKIRADLTREIIKKNNVGLIEVEVVGSTKIEQVIYTLSFGGYLSYYLALLNSEDPAKIPWVDLFKTKLASHDKT
ncbi:hypothetical protein HY030_00125 [Candidatus Gottesmanbacteria bacterium]|nr:hypothetical protein [Candidatus Gottesmanbacteria bacterium]